ncbi:hypothetical protein CR513_15891, partial [Mucuna pruriens]
MDVKCAFLNGIINEIFVKETPSFETSTMYLYEKLNSFLMINGFQRGKVDTILFHKNYDSHFIVVQIYVDDIILGSINDSKGGEFYGLMQKEFEMNMMGELKFSWTAN